jgi:hypothetical protein
VEQLTSLSNLENIGTKGNLYYIVDLSEPTHASEEELMHSRGIQTPFCLKNLLSLPHLPTKKTRGKEPLMDYI